MIATFNGRPFKEFKAQGYSTEEVEEIINDKRVMVETNEEAGSPRVRGGAPRHIIEAIEEVSSQ